MAAVRRFAPGRADSRSPSALGRRIFMLLPPPSCGSGPILLMLATSISLVCSSCRSHAHGMTGIWQAMLDATACSAHYVMPLGVCRARGPLLESPTVHHSYVCATLAGYIQTRRGAGASQASISAVSLLTKLSWRGSHAASRDLHLASRIVDSRKHAHLANDDSRLPMCLETSRSPCERFRSAEHRASNLSVFINTAANLWQIRPDHILTSVSDGSSMLLMPLPPTMRSAAACDTCVHAKASSRSRAAAAFGTRLRRTPVIVHTFSCSR